MKVNASMLLVLY